MPKYRDRWPVYAKQWDGMQRTRLSMAQDAAERILANKAKYQAVEAKTGVPWWWIGPTHYRESDLNFHTQLAQGDPLNQVSTHVPKGQGPYFGDDAWERAAIIAIEDHGLDRIIDWRVEKAIYWWESYNGWGYFNHSVPSAYVWAGTSIYAGGMYIADGVWSETAADRRVGCAAILKCLIEMDQTIVAIRETPDLIPPMPQSQPFPPPEPKPVPTPVPTPVPQPTRPTLDPETQAMIAQAIAAGLGAAITAIRQNPGALASIMKLFGSLVTGSPFVAIILGLAQVFLTNADVIGMPGIGGTPTANNTAAGILAMFVAGITSWLRPKESTK